MRALARVTYLRGHDVEILSICLISQPHPKWRGKVYILRSPICICGNTQGEKRK